MIPLLVLLTVFGISALLYRLNWGVKSWPHAGRVALGVMFCFTAIGHFKYTQGMAMMIPANTSLATLTVWLTGIFEFICGVLLCTRWYARVRLWVFVFLILALPANVYGALHHINYQEANHTGPGLSYLWFRVPLQLFWIGWLYFSAMRIDVEFVNKG